MSKTEPKTKPNTFMKFAHRASVWTGSARAFVLAVTFVLIWLVTGPVFNFSQTWQLVINTATTIITFLMVFLIQNTQNRDTKAMHLKLDELIRSSRAARDHYLNAEELPDDELDALHAEFEEIHRTYEEEVLRRRGRTK